MVTLNVGAFAFENESGISETTSSVGDGEVSSSDIQNAENDDPLSSLSEHEQIVFLLCFIIGCLLAVAFNFWKW